MMIILNLLLWSALSMKERHLLTDSHQIVQKVLHLAATKSQGKIMGLPLNTFIILVVAASICITLCCCIWVAYRRRRTRQDYNQNPQQFPHLPDLSTRQQKNLKNKEVKELIAGDDKLIIQKRTEEYQGPYYRIVFRGLTPQAVIFDHQLKNKNYIYFEVQVLNLHGQILIGFGHVDSREKIQAKDQAIGNFGVTLSTSGFVVANGENVYNYNWNLDYGDVIGIGLTKETDKFNERRAWISKNGVLLNSPPADEMDKWLATVQISAKEREKFEKEKQKVDEVSKDAEAADKAAQAQKLAYQKEQALLTSQKIALKTFKGFDYYPMVFYQGAKGDQVKDKKSVIHLNVGGQVFRMQQAQFKGGVLQ